MGRPVDLNRICATIHHGCMGLPQELVDHVMVTLCNDNRALKACSLTCKAMFASARPLLHRSLRLCYQNALRLLTREEQRRCGGGDRDVGFLRMFHLDECGLLQYVRQVHIMRIDPPGSLLPHLHRFQSPNRVHTLIIDYIFPSQWVNYHSTVFARFYPTLTSLKLREPRDCEWLLNFTLWFPNLENLSIAAPRVCEKLVVVDTAAPERTPPLRGCLSLANSHGPYSISDQSAGSFRVPSKGFNVFNFRSVELYDKFLGNQAQGVLNACARTETLTIHAFPLSKLRLLFPPSAIDGRISDPSIEFYELRLTKMAVLRRLTLLASFLYGRPHLDRSSLVTLSTIVSPVFCELVLVLDGSPPEIQSMGASGLWGDFDRFFEERFARHGDLRLIIVISYYPSDWGDLQREVERDFPLLAERGCIYLERSCPVYRYSR